MSEEPLLRPEEVAGVLAGLDGDATPDLSGDGPCMPIPYSLREPVALPQEAEPYARKKVEAMAAAIETCWRRELATEVSIEVEGFQQQRAGVALSVVPSPAWTFGFLDPAGGGVAIVLDPGIGLALVEAALGGAGKPVDTGRAPTPLESRVMERLGSAAAAGIRTAAESALMPTGLVVGALPAGLASDGETLGVGLLRIRLPQGERAALLLATAPILSPRRRRRPWTRHRRSARSRPGSDGFGSRSARSCPRDSRTSAS